MTWAVEVWRSDATDIDPLGRLAEDGGWLGEGVLVGKEEATEFQTRAEAEQAAEDICQRIGPANYEVHDMTGQRFERPTAASLLGRANARIAAALEYIERACGVKVVCVHMSREDSGLRVSVSVEAPREAEAAYKSK